MPYNILLIIFIIIIIFVVKKINCYLIQHDKFFDQSRELYDQAFNAFISVTKSGLKFIQDN